MQLRCLIVDDEQLARRLLAGYVKKIAHLELVGECKSPLEAVKVLENEQVDLLLLDIQMPDLLGTDFLKSLVAPPLVIFTTAYTKYAVEGYALDIIDYLLKPIPFPRFLQAINKATEQFRLRKQADLPTDEVASDVDFMTIRADHKLYKVHYHDILYIEGLREYVRFHTVQRRIMTLDSLKRLEADLPANFLRVHKSYIVNKSKVDVLGSSQLEILGHSIPIGGSYRDKVTEEMFG